VLDREVIHTKAKAYSQTGGLAILFGNIAPEGAVVKKAAVAPEMLKHSGPAGSLTPKKKSHRPLCRVRLNRVM